MSSAANELPLRAELFSASQLEAHARSLATAHQLGKGDDHGVLLRRLADNHASLGAAYALVADAVARGRQITPAAEWFVDNYHLIEDQIRIAIRHLPRNYSRALPRLTSGTLRVYELALELISHSHGHVDGDTLRAFVAAYQTIQPLQLGELWAIPIMLRIALIENLRRVVAAVTAGRREREAAGQWADRLLEGAAGDPSQVVRVLAELVAADPVLTTPFVAELASRLQGQGAVSVLPVAWLEQRLEGQGQTVEGVFQSASQSQAADQVSVGNSITSLRTLDAIDWRDFVETLSVVEDVLRGDPAGAYTKMEFATRDRYRHVVELLARRGKLVERAVAAKAIALAAAAPEGRERHVGYFLIGRGRRALSLALAERPHDRALRRRVARGVGVVVYVGLVALITAGCAGAVAAMTWTRVHHDAWLAVWAIAVAVCASQLALSLVHWGSTLAFKPQPLPRLDFSAGIPDAHRTLVAVPVILTSEASIDHLVDLLEVRFLANRDRNLGFALVTDFKDAPTEHTDGDDRLVAHASAAIAALDAKYADPATAGGFFLFHRARRYNPRERLWMGWERKRGKLEDLNAMLRGDSERFTTVVGPTERLAKIRYVIVLDSDTALPRDAAHELVGTMAHPLNQPVIDAQRGCVTDGYAILQPRVGTTLDSAHRTRFTRLFAPEPGIDPYTRAVSDVYQDLFAEGSFIGKGIYDVDAVRDVLEGVLPDNRVLSHDLLEGAYCRAGLVSDVLVFEDFPSTYAVDASRRSRWIRGDWQIARWLWSRVPSPRRPKNPISWLSRWKILDNLRRSIVPVAMLALLVVGWTLPGAAAVAIGLVVATLAIPPLLGAYTDLERRPKELAPEEHARTVRRQLGHSLLREAFSVACLPADAALSVSAIVRVALRLWITKRKLLEWRTAADAERMQHTGLAATYAAMWIAPVTAAAIAVQLVFERVDAAWLAAPMAALWAIAPALAWWMSRPIAAEMPHLDRDEQLFLRLVARRTWRFFRTYVTADDHDLPPDNVQEDPPVGVAHRTSPTNIGLALLANLTARDFGYATIAEVIARTEATFATLERLQRFRGHFYNWYDTRSLEPLRPMYVSTVDSGNLAGHLITLAEGLRGLAHQPVIGKLQLDGIADTIALLEELGVPAPELSVVRELTRLPIRTLGEARDALARIAAAARVVADRADTDERAWWRKELQRQVTDLAAELADLVPAGLDAIPTLAELGERAAERIARLTALARQAEDLGDFEYDFLYDANRHLFSIGYNVTDHRLDNSFYDLLASEARLASFVAIAQNKLPQEHWFHLGRRVTSTEGQPTLLSWSGSMFEYLMPLLVMPTYSGTLLDATYHAAVARQIAYGTEREVPWGISESGYNKTDAHLNYQYRAFGVPGLGFKRGLASDLVIAPYASAMALMVAPGAATRNLERLARDHQLGPYGFYEAIDYTPSRLPPGKPSVTVKSYMAHHQGMTFLALAYTLLDRPMQRRFLASPAMRATDLVLHERVPRTPAVYPHPAEASAVRTTTDGDRELRVFASPNTPAPEVQLLSNGNYHVVVTNSGGGYSRWRDYEVTRWQEDPTRDCWGQFCYIRDIATGTFWSAAHQPTLRAGTSYEAIFSAGRAEFRRLDDEIDTHVEIAVSPEDDLELRRISITNRGTRTRTLELTTFAEVVLNVRGADAAHRAFSGLFVQSEIVADFQAILCTRRPRAPNEKPPWLIHMMVVHGPTVGEMTFETDRGELIGRDGTPADPRALHRKRLGNSQGAVLDPCVAIRNTVELAADQVIQLHIATGVAETRDGALALADKYRARHFADRVLELAWVQSQVLQRRLDASNAEVRMWEQLAGHVIYANPRLRAPKSLVAANQLGQAGLWPYSISGDLPIVIVRITASENLELVRQLVRAHMYWRLKGLAVDLVIWNEDPSGYRQNLHEQILAAIAVIGDSSLIDQKGGVFIRRTDQMTDADRILFQTVARVIVSDAAGTLAEQLDRRPRHEPVQPVKFEVLRARGGSIVAIPPVQRPDLAAFNGHGGFTKDGREYVITTTREARTPAPWTNVLANSYFGTVVSETGAGYTWCENAQMYRLTPWSNDPVGDPGGEAIYLRDEEDGAFWSPTVHPAPGAQQYTTRHGFGYSVFETQEAGIASELTVFVAMDAPVKLYRLKLKNRSGRTVKLSATAYFELVLGVQRAVTAPHVVTEVDPRTGALFARNAYGDEFAPRVAFLECSEAERSVTGDRTEFLGRGGTLARPAALMRQRLSGRTGAAFDPCLAMQVAIELADGSDRELVFAFGSGRDIADARYIVGRYRGAAAAQDGLAAVWEFWNRMLGAVYIETPDESVNFLANGWLLYQVLAARMWGRSGFYQSGGAFGFRDQLQDACALLHADPALFREQLLRSAAHQFPQGDVQHWWHPPAGRGVRTRISDDYLWLPYAVARFVTATGDTGVLDEKTHFIEGRAVNPNEESYYDLPARSVEIASLYDHCVRAIEHGMRLGAHGLPLMGTGDWNDGMNLVGDEGKGESIWLALFLVEVLRTFEPIARRRADTAFADSCLARIAELRANLEAHAWDGAWYRRGYYDDGSPLGSAANDECQIDALPQSWAVLAESGAPDRVAQGLDALDSRLVDSDLGVIKLFDPPFDHSAQNPGYIKGYVPGVRENGGQYTHAAVWSVMAFAAAGRTERAWQLLAAIDPIHHGDTPQRIARYRVEPYVMAADIYTNPLHAGRGGWTWYTGSAGWMYRLVTESLLGLRLEVDHLRLEPVIPADWPGFAVHYRFRNTVHHIHVTRRPGNSRNVLSVTCDTQPQADHRIPLQDDGREHWIEVVVGDA